jgi:hypothetical protein
VFSEQEITIITEVQEILLSRGIIDLRAAYILGESVEVSITGRIIIYEPELPASGFTLSGEASFVLGPQAFSSEVELIKTLLHELYRLTTSVILETDTATSAEIIEV